MPRSHNSDELDGQDEGYGGEGSEINKWDSDIDKSGELGEQGREDDTEDDDKESQKVGEEGSREGGKSMKIRLVPDSSKYSKSKYCPVRGCKTKQPLKKLSNHLKSMHPELTDQ